MITLNDFVINGVHYVHQIDTDNDQTQLSENGEVLYTVDFNANVYVRDFEEKIGAFRTDSDGYWYFRFTGGNKFSYFCKKDLVATELAFFKQLITLDGNKS